MSWPSTTDRRRGCRVRGHRARRREGLDLRGRTWLGHFRFGGEAVVRRPGPAETGHYVTAVNYDRDRLPAPDYRTTGYRLPDYRLLPVERDQVDALGRRDTELSHQCLNLAAVVR